MTEIKARNHYIPITYLEKFLNDKEQLFIYKKGEKFFKDGLTKKDRLLVVQGRESLNNIGIKRKLYVPQTDKIEDKNIVEDFFDDEFDSKYTNFVKSVEENFSDVPSILKKHNDYIINLIASMMSRTLHSKKEIEELYKVSFQTFHWAQSGSTKKQEYKTLLKERFQELSDSEAEEQLNDYLRMVEEGKFSMNISIDAFVKEMFNLMEIKAELISDMTVQILRNETQVPFITSDAPGVYFVPDNKVCFPFGAKSLGGPHTELYFPLSKTICLVLSRKQIEVLAGIPMKDDKIINIINNAIANNSRDFIYSPRKIGYLEKFIKKHIPYPFRLTFK